MNGSLRDTSVGSDRAADHSDSVNWSGSFVPPDAVWIGGYREVRLLGRGGMGTTYVVAHPLFEREDALKVIRAEVAGHPEYQADFLGEMRTLAALTHPHIVPILAAGKDGDKLFFVMEYLTGGDLREWIKAHRTQGDYLRRAAGLLRQVALAVQHAHTRPVPVIHRDLKPANVLLTADHGRAKLADFGLAKLGVGRSGRVGTLPYMAPEQAAGGEVDARADVYGLGAVLYEVLAGRPPFTESDTTKLERQVIAHDPPPPPHGADPKLEAVRRKCMARNPNERYRSAAEVAAALDAYLRPGWARRNWPRVLTAAMAAAAVALAAFAGWQWWDKAQAREHTKEALQKQLGATDRATLTDACRKADELLKSSGPDADEVRRWRAEAYTKLADLDITDCKYPDAKSRLDEAKQELDLLNGRGGNVPQFALVQAEWHHQRGRYYQSNSEADTSAEEPTAGSKTVQLARIAGRHFQQSLDVLAPFGDDARTEEGRKLQRKKARALGFQGDTQIVEGRFKDAEQTYERASGIRASLVTCPHSTPDEKRGDICMHARDYGNLAALAEYDEKTWNRSLDKREERCREYVAHLETRAETTPLPDEFLVERAESRINWAEMSLLRAPRPEHNDIAEALAAVDKELNALSAERTQVLQTELHRRVVAARSKLDHPKLEELLQVADPPPSPKRQDNFPALAAEGKMGSGEYYQWAVAYALLARAERDPDRKVRYETLAIDRLNTAAAKGFIKFLWLEHDQAFSELHGNQDFERVMKRIEDAAPKPAPAGGPK